MLSVKRAYPIRHLWKRSLMARLVGYFLLLAIITSAVPGYLAFAGARDALQTEILNR